MKPFILTICVMASGVATAVAAAVVARVDEPRATPRVLPRPAPVEAVRRDDPPGDSAGAEEHRPRQARSLVGLVVPARQVTVRAPVDGVVAAVARQAGERVAAGTVLVTLDDGAVKLEAERCAARLAATLHYTAAAAAEVELLEQKVRQLRSVRDQRAASTSELAQVECQLRAAAARVKALGEERREQEVGLRELRRRADAHRIAAPIEGEVAEAARVTGEYVRAGEPVATVRSTRRHIRVHLPASLASGVAGLRFRLAGTGVAGDAVPLERLDAATAAGAASVALAVPEGVSLAVGQTVTVDVEAP